MSLRILAAALAVALAADAATYGETHEQDTASLEVKKKTEYSTDNFADKLVDKLVGHVLKKLPSHHTDLDNMSLAALAKPQPTKIHATPYTSLRSRPVRPSLRSQVPLLNSRASDTLRSPFQVLQSPIAHSLPIVAASSSKRGQQRVLAEGATKSKLEEAFAFFIKNYLFIALGVAIVTALNFPSLGQATAATKVLGMPFSTFAGMYIFFISGAQLKTEEVKKAISAWKPALFGIALINFITPFLAVPLGALSFLQTEIQKGFIIFANMPTVTSMGSQLSLQAGGNFAFAIMVATIANIVCIFQIPFYLSFFLSGTGTVQLDAVAMQWKLITNILVPLALGKLISTPTIVANFLKKYSTLVKMSLSTALASLPFLEISKNVDGILGLPGTAIFQVIGVAAGMHVSFLAICYALTALYKTPVDIRKTLIILGSQKQLVVSLAVLSALPDGIGNKGIMAIPCIIGWLAQNLIDSYIAPKMVSWGEKEAATS